MYLPKTKLESDALIQKLRLNYVPFINSFTKEQARHAVEVIPPPIGFRCKTKPSGNLIGNMSKKEALLFIENQDLFDFPYSVYSDIRQIDTDLIYQGEIQLHPDGTMVGQYCTVPGIKNREACIHPKSIHFGVPYQSPNVLKQVSWDWRPVREIVDYCCEYHLVGPVVEYSYFSTKLGVRNEQIVIWEIRNF